MAVTIRLTARSPSCSRAGVETRLSAVVIWIVVAKRTGITAPVVIVAPIWRDEGVRRNGAGLQVSVKAARAVKTDNVGEVAARLDAFLHTAKLK